MVCASSLATGLTAAAAATASAPRYVLYFDQ